MSGTPTTGGAFPDNAAAPGAPQRTNTPPRYGTAPIRLLRIHLDDRVLGGVEVGETSTLADVRVSITEDEIPGVPQGGYIFLFGGAPVTRRQEARRRAVDCFPFLTIIPEDTRIAPVASVGGATPSTSSGGRAGSPGFDLPGLASAAGGVGVGAVAGAPSAARSSLEFTEEATLLGLAGGDDVSEALGSGLDAGDALELQITDGPLEGTTVTVGVEGARVGRHTSNTLVIPEAGISRYHCEIRYIDGEFCVRDLGSTTGTFFYLRPHERFQMFTGLLVKLGETELQVLSQTIVEGEIADQAVLFYEGPLAGQKVYVPLTGISIGRRHDNHLALPQDGTVSARHAAICSEDADFYISDLGSCNGTCIRLSPERTNSDWHPIIDGDILGAGCTKIRCRQLVVRAN